MKLRIISRREAGLTLYEVGIVVAVIAVLAMLLLPILAAVKRKSSKLGCVNNLKQVGLAYRVWAGDNGNIYPMGLSRTNGGSMEMVITGDVVQTFSVMSNELATPRVLCCPYDSARLPTFAFGGLANSNISYFINPDVTDGSNPQAMLTGDGNFEWGGKPVNSGLLSLWTNDPVAWSASRHFDCGNLLLGDDSVQTVTSNGLHNCFVNAGRVTNWFAIP